MTDITQEQIDAEIERRLYGTTPTEEAGGFLDSALTGLGHAATAAGTAITAAGTRATLTMPADVVAAAGWAGDKLVGPLERWAGEALGTPTPVSNFAKWSAGQAKYNREVSDAAVDYVGESIKDVETPDFGLGSVNLKNVASGVGTVVGDLPAYFAPFAKVATMLKTGSAAVRQAVKISSTAAALSFQGSLEQAHASGLDGQEAELYAMTQAGIEGVTSAIMPGAAEGLMKRMPKMTTGSWTKEVIKEGAKEGLGEEQIASLLGVSADVLMLPKNQNKPVFETILNEYRKTIAETAAVGGLAGSGIQGVSTLGDISPTKVIPKKVTPDIAPEELRQVLQDVGLELAGPAFPSRGLAETLTELEETSKAEIVDRDGIVEIRFPNRRSIYVVPTTQAEMNKLASKDGMKLAIKASADAKGLKLKDAVPRAFVAIQGKDGTGVLADASAIIYATTGATHAELLEEVVHSAGIMMMEDVELNAINSIMGGKYDEANLRNNAEFQEDFFANVYMPWVRGELDVKSQPEALSLLKRVWNKFAEWAKILKLSKFESEPIPEQQAKLEAQAESALQAIESGEALGREIQEGVEPRQAGILTQRKKAELADRGLAVREQNVENREVRAEAGKTSAEASQLAARERLRRQAASRVGKQMDQLTKEELASLDTETATKVRSIEVDIAKQANARDEALGKAQKRIHANKISKLREEKRLILAEKREAKVKAKESAIKGKAPLATITSLGAETPEMAARGVIQGIAEESAHQNERILDAAKEAADAVSDVTDMGQDALYEMLADIQDDSANGINTAVNALMAAGISTVLQHKASGNIRRGRKVTKQVRKAEEAFMVYQQVMTAGSDILAAGKHTKQMRSQSPVQHAAEVRAEVERPSVSQEAKLPKDPARRAAAMRKIAADNTAKYKEMMKNLLGEDVDLSDWTSFSDPLFSVTAMQVARISKLDGWDKAGAIAELGARLSMFGMTSAARLIPAVAGAVGIDLVSKYLAYANRSPAKATKALGKAAYAMLTKSWGRGFNTAWTNENASLKEYASTSQTTQSADEAVDKNFVSGIDILTNGIKNPFTRRLVGLVLEAPMRAIGAVDQFGQTGIGEFMREMGSEILAANNPELRPGTPAHDAALLKITEDAMQDTAAQRKFEGGEGGMNLGGNLLKQFETTINSSRPAVRGLVKATALPVFRGPIRGAEQALRILPGSSAILLAHDMMRVNRADPQHADRARTQVVKTIAGTLLLPLLLGTMLDDDDLVELADGGVLAGHKVKFLPGLGDLAVPMAKWTKWANNGFRGRDIHKAANSLSDLFWNFMPARRFVEGASTPEVGDIANTSPLLRIAAELYGAETAEARWNEFIAAYGPTRDMLLLVSPEYAEKRGRGVNGIQAMFGTQVGDRELKDIAKAKIADANPTLSDEGISRIAGTQNRLGTKLSPRRIAKEAEIQAYMDEHGLRGLDKDEAKAAGKSRQWRRLQVLKKRR